MENEKQNRSEQRATILRYLAACPRAADTKEGVVHWWLARQRYNDTYAVIEQILEELVAEGLVTKVTLPDNKVIYTCPEKYNNDK
jgi:Fe2+ or Zn2+ uptake regulation protein